MNGKSDPFVKVYWDTSSKKLKTPTQHKTLNPEWNFRVEMPPPESSTAMLILDVYDWDKLGRNEFLGRATVSMDELSKLYPGPTFYKLELQAKTKDKDKDKKPVKKLQGTIHFSVHLLLKEKLKPQLHFGRALSESVKRTQDDNYPHLIDKALEFLVKEEAINSEGIIRIPGGKSEIYKLKDEFDVGKSLSFEGEDPFVVAGLLKLYFYELPDSLFPQKEFMMARKIDTWENLKSSVPALKQIIDQMSELNIGILKRLIQYFVTLSNNSSVNKMDSRAVAISIGPSILIAPDIREDPLQFVSATKVAQSIMQCMILYAGDLGLAAENATESSLHSLPPPPLDIPPPSDSPTDVPPPPPTDLPGPLPPPTYQPPPNDAMTPEAPSTPTSLSSNTETDAPPLSTSSSTTTPISSPPLSPFSPSN
eukprot:TRINITY_DN2335_c0_g1_i1.p1 TRINITY_DN2335_c0_g1~~TRINITY_DN2335_c0_g1_i1.p1  ORF type:complete len:422 (-),score=133.91 TRINITY_DN2335_c0_g1_i1:50-1315(-)